MASIKDLDNPLLVLILNRLCIQKLFTAGHVCVRWNAMRDMSVRERKELVLLVGNDAKSYIDESKLAIPDMAQLVDENGDVMFPDNDQNDFQLQIYSFPLDFVRLLLANFTNLTTLTVSTRVNDSKEIDSVINLLEQFNRPNGTLNTLKLYSGSDQNTTELNTNQLNQNIRRNLRLLSAVNSIGSLRKLTFDVNVKFVRKANYPRIDLPILAQLEVFEFNSADRFARLYKSITRYAVNNPRLRRIGIHLPTNDFTWLLALSTKLSSRFTHLHFRSHFDGTEFEDLCRHFSNLTSLELTIEGSLYTAVRRFRALTHLPNLLSLAVNIGGRFMIPLAVYGRRILHFELPSVKVFTINIVDSPTSHNFFYDCNMNRLFPNVQVVRVTAYNAALHPLCVNCEKLMKKKKQKKFPLWSEASVARLEEHCARYMFRRFDYCRSLRIVSSKVVGYSQVAGPRYREWAWNEMAPFESEAQVLKRIVEDAKKPV